MTKYLVYAHFNGDNDYSSMRSSRTIIETTTPRFRVQLDRIEELKYNVDNTVTGKVTDSNGTGISCSNITIKIIKTGQDTITKTVSAGANGIFSFVYKPLSQGEYTISATANAEKGYTAGTDEMTVISGLKDSVLTLKTDNTSYVANQTITLTASLTDNQGNALANQNIKLFLDNSTTPFTTLKTNKQGVVMTSQKLSSIGEHYFIAVYDGTTDIKPSSSNINDCKFRILKHVITVVPYENNIYNSWKLRYDVYTEGSNPITLTTFKIVITGANTSLTYSLKTNDKGYMETESLNLQPGEYEVHITGGPWANYDSVDLKYKIQVFNYDSVNVTPSSAINLYSDIPYRVWDNLSNITAEDGSVALCGKKCTSAEAIAGKNGSRNTPSTISCKHNVSIVSNAVLKRCDIRMKCKTVSCSSASAKPKIMPPTAKIGTKTQLFTCNTSDGQLPYGELAWVTASFNTNNISLYDLDSSDLEISFPSNANTNPGQIQIDQIIMEIDYIPQQEE